MGSMTKLSKIIILFCAIALIAAPLKVYAQTERNYLTVEILEQKTHSLIQREGRDTIDLSNYIIDLSQADNELNREFYQQINYLIAHNNNPINIDFSNSVFQGNFQLNRLGISSFLGEGALSSLFTPLEQEKIQQYYPIVKDFNQKIPTINVFRGSLYFDSSVFTGEVDASDSLFLQAIAANAVSFQRGINFARSVFSREVNFSNTNFIEGINFSKTHFFAQTKFNQINGQGILDFSNSQFENIAEFNKSIFNSVVDFSNSIFVDSINFDGAIFRDRLTFAEAKFFDSLVLVNSTLEKTITLRDIYLKSLINLQNAHLFNKVDLSNALFTPYSRIDVSGLAFDSIEAKITGQPGVIGRLIKVSQLSGNEVVLRNLIRNFRNLEQITDANYIEYRQQQLREKQIGDRLAKWQVFTFAWLGLIPQWLGLNLLLLLGDYGTNINSIFSIGIITIAFFSLLFWLLDRYRPNISDPVVPTRYETTAMVASCVALTLFSIINIFIATNQPWFTLVAIALVLIPIPIAMVSFIYRRGRYHPQLDTSYFVENGQYREFRLLLGRLPIIPRFPFFRDRFMPILWEKRWNWLNYYDFSLNNIFKLGFNDIRLRDRHLPGLISTLVWYQWCLGVLYIILLLWTLSRTIPGLNLLIYF